ncbi:hypothetical protein IED13_10655 [Bosea sp. SSUT16]|uniref:Uncharacterized protein n=1 Tax=Bosea spartocytisi TaxID=2773451 RepID=A0A927E878_9HYPH|nr:hypothetical protein [Bosea spartocytisi]MBD3846158.1 hypothetical protein [Bosea spartocytisi]MCT4473342.1 hypothetical protein [Bosea spartocytisi]
MSDQVRAVEAPKPKPPKAPDIGLGYGSLICNMSTEKRLAFIAEGVPLIHASARSLMEATNTLKEYPREAEILEGQAIEECAKILILVDIIRCPAKVVSSRVGTMIRWFYDHLARRIYAKAQTWKPTSLAELQEYIDYDRRSHFVDGDYFEHIMPNSELFWREAALYADVVSNGEGEPQWHTPLRGMGRIGSWDPPVFSLVNSLAAAGAFSPKGLAILRDTWGSIEFKGDVSWDAVKEPCEAMLKALFDAGLVSESITKGDVSLIRGNWQMPMYHLDFAKVAIPLEDLKREQEARQPRE